MVASVPVISTKPCRLYGESKLKMLCEDSPFSNSAMALTREGTVTANSSPVFGLESMTRVSRDFDPKAATFLIEPKT